VSYGFRVPILALRDGEIVDGELRWKAARELGLVEVPVLPADDLSPERVRAFRIMVNKSATWAEWDEDVGCIGGGLVSDEEKIDAWRLKRIP
jgi:ParB-like chromosome segregation protein Spo0J